MLQSLLLVLNYFVLFDFIFFVFFDFFSSRFFCFLKLAFLSASMVLRESFPRHGLTFFVEKQNKAKRKKIFFFFDCLFGVAQDSRITGMLVLVLFLVFCCLCDVGAAQRQRPRRRTPSSSSSSSSGSNVRIIGGVEERDRSRVPYVVSLRIRGTQGMGKCSGSIYSATQIISAAHCQSVFFPLFFICSFC